MQTQVGRFRRLVRGGTTGRVAEAATELFGVLVPALPVPLRRTPIGRVAWSQPFATNEWWRKVWRELGVDVVDDLTGIGARLAQTRGIGRIKLLVLVEDLLGLASAGPDSAGRSRAIALIAGHRAAIEASPSELDPIEVVGLFEALVSALPATLQAARVETLPWSGGWCDRPGFWTEMGVALVDDLGAAAEAMARTRGIGRNKLLRIADDLIDLCPELHDRLRPAEPVPLRSRRGRARPAADSLAVAVDRLVDRLSPRHRDVLRRRLGWRHPGPPETLRTLAQDQGVTLERIRQVEARLRERLARLLRLRGTVDLLLEAALSRPGPTDLADLLVDGPPELRGLDEVWRPLALLLEDEGRIRLVEDPDRPGRVLVEPTRRSPAEATGPSPREGPTD